MPASTEPTSSLPSGGGRSAERARAAAPTKGELLLTAGLAAAVLIASIVPWWTSELPLARTAPWLNLWGLLATGLSLPPLGAGTGFSWVGNLLFGLIGTLPTLALLIALVVRALRPSAVTAKLLRNLGIAAALGALWMFLFAWNRQEAANGKVLVSLGPWLMLLLGIAVAVLGARWWSREKARAPRPVAADEEAPGGAASEQGRLEELVGIDLDGDGDVGAAQGSRTARAPQQDRFAFTADDAVDDDEPDTGSIRIDTLRDDAGLQDARPDDGEPGAARGR